MIRKLLLFGITFLLLSACEQQEGQAPSAQADSASTQKIAEPLLRDSAPPKLSDTGTSVLLHEPVTLQRYELPSQALADWYELRADRPVLLLYGNDPLLQRTSPTVQKNLMERLSNRDLHALRIDIPAPAILPKMSLHAALEAGFFSEVYWVMPVRDQIEDLSVEVFREQLVQLGALSEDEARTLTLRDGVVSGTVRGVPFHALHPDANYSIERPVVFHFDLSYLSPFYRNEIKTPIFPLIYQTLKHVRAQQVRVAASTFSYSQLSGDVPLGSRFVGAVLEQLLHAPEMLDSGLPAPWQQRANALYLPELFKAEEARNILLELATQSPEDPSLHYALYNISRTVKPARQAALGHLAEAVRLDSTYALEYLALAPVALEKGSPEDALNMLSLAHQAAPDNPFYRLELARGMLSNGQRTEALPLLHELRGLDWSPFFYSQMPEFLDQLTAEASSTH